MKKIVKQFWLTLLLGIMILSFLGLHLYGVHPNRLARAGEEGQMVRIEPQLGVSQIAQRLKEKGIVSSRWLFQIAAFLRGSATHLQAGEYAFAPDMSLLEVLRKLERGEVFHYTVTVPEAWTMREIARYLDSRGLAEEERFWRLCHDQEVLQRYGIRAHSLEGYLFPDTYFLVRGMKEEEIIDRMVKRFLQVFTAEHEEKASEQGLNRHQAVILASLIEAETPRGDERYLVSSVFHRRLRIRMPLQCDPTVIYALSGKDGRKGRLSRRDLAFRSPYNTYVHPGLPPGPICSPGAASFEAAIAPAPSPYLYFVSKGNGSHHFSSTLAEHYRAVRQYQSPPGRSSGGTEGVENSLHSSS